MKKRGRGRPKLPKKDAKGAVMTVRFTKAERKAVDDAAGREGLKTSEWVRNVLLATAGFSNLGKVDSEDAGIEPPGAATPGPRDVKPH